MHRQLVILNYIYHFPIYRESARESRFPFFIAHANTFFARLAPAFNSSETLQFPYPSGYTFCTPTLATCSWRRRQAPVAVSPPPRPSR